uniref:adenylate/guanylate cyclase domain-containing protein n=2 Tax=Oscillatoria sp. FACHB-1407 TaxID=2692847 RepID=UPI001F54FCE3|nr:adenylate/guanylate cyclase domain-containing protein [Oscillatoria sp. FACHB-1407]
MTASPHLPNSPSSDDRISTAESNPAASVNPVEVAPPDSTVVDMHPRRMDTDSSGMADVIDVIAQVEKVEEYNSLAEPMTPAEGAIALSDADLNAPPTGALATTRGSFSSFLAPLTQDTFKQVVTDVEQKLQVVNQTLSMLDDMLSSQGFDAILDEMLRSITLKTGELLNADRTTIFLLDEEKDELWSIVAKDENGNNLELRFPKTAGIAGEVATTKAVVNIPYDFYNDPRSKTAQESDKKNHYRTYTMLAMPLLGEQGDLVAVVQLLNKLKLNYDPHATLEDKIDMDGFSSHDEQLFEEFAPSIRLILESSRSFYKATQKQRAASALMKATKSLSQSSLDLEETLGRVMEEAKELMQADRSTLWLLDRDSHELWTKIPINNELKEYRIPMSAGFAGQVATTGEPLLIPFDLYDHPNSAISKETDQKTGYRTCSILCMPVFNADNELIAVTQLINKRKQGDHPPYDPANYPEAPECWRASFNRNDLEFMQAFNIQAGVALQNAKLFATVKQQEQTQRDILRSLSNGVISTDKDGKIIAANESAKKLLGLDESKPLEGQLVTELVQLEKGKFSEYFYSVINAEDHKDRQEYYPDQTLQTANKKEQHSINLSINTIADATDSNNVSGALVVMDDISDEKRLKSTMYRYMSQEIAEQVLKGGEVKLGGDRREVSVLFSDIRGYTTLTETMEAEEVVEMLNEYFEAMVGAVFENKGTLDKYIGDAIMAVFGSPLPIEDHAYQAVKTAIDMRHRLEEFNEKRIESDQPIIRIGIGINSDVVVTGNIGSKQRVEFTSIGDGVNLGSRLEGASKLYGTDIVISETTYQPCADRIWARELDCIRVKGKNKPVSIYELIGLTDDPLNDRQLRTIDLYQKGRSYYLDRKFRLALNEFATIVDELNNDDKAAKLHMERCTYYLTHPPDDETWNDGVWTLTEK